MTAFTDLDDLAVVMTGGGAGPIENLWAYKTMKGAVNITAESGTWRSWWTFNGMPGPGTIPTSVEAPTSATTGAIPFTNAAGGREKFLAQALGFPIDSAAPTTLLYDRLLHMGGFVTSTGTAQTVGGTLTRNTGGEGNEIWIEVEATVSARLLTVSYTNQAGTAGRSTPDFDIGNGSSTATTVYRLPLQAGDTGVRSVQSVTMVETTASGQFAVVVANPLLLFGANGKSMIEPPWPKIEDNACLALASSVMNYGPMTFSMATVER